MCCTSSSRSLSRLSITAGLLSLITVTAALLTNAWLYTREPVNLPKSQEVTTVTFRIGLWRVCPTLKRVIATPSTLLPTPGCQLIRYSGWKEVKESDVGISWSSSLEFTPSFITKMRYATPLVGLAGALLTLATLFALLGHCSSDLKTLVACGLYTIGGLMLASGLVVFVSVLSDVYTDRPRHSRLDYRYGWSFHAAGASFVLSEVAALVSITAYLQRFSTVEEMVRAMVPGADRKLRRHQACAEYLGRSRQGGAERAEPEGETPPDICTTKPPHHHFSISAAPITNRNLVTINHRPQIPMRDHGLAASHPATLVLPEHEPYRYTTIIHQGLLGVAEGTSSSASSASSGVTYSSHSLPRGRLPPRLQRSASPSSGSPGT